MQKPTTGLINGVAEQIIKYSREIKLFKSYKEGAAFEKIKEIEERGRQW